MYFWGANEYGQMGLKEYRPDINETINFPTAMDTTLIGDRKIVDFALSEKCTVVRLEDDSVFWMGLKLNYHPEEF